MRSLRDWDSFARTRHPNPLCGPDATEIANNSCLTALRHNTLSHPDPHPGNHQLIDWGHAGLGPAGWDQALLDNPAALAQHIVAAAGTRNSARIITAAIVQRTADGAALAPGHEDRWRHTCQRLLGHQLAIYQAIKDLGR